MHQFEKLVTQIRRIAVPKWLADKLQWQYVALLELITLGKGVPRIINGEPAIQVDPRFRSIPETYEPQVCAWVKQHVQEGDVLFDVGAHLGVYSILGSRWVGDSGKVFAFEPSPDTVHALKRNISLSGATKSIEVVEVAVGSASGIATLFTVGVDDHNALCHIPEALVNPKTVSVAVITLDSFCKRNSVLPKIVKIDTEGWELHVLRGSVELLKNDQLRFVTEMHPYAWEGAGYNRQAFEMFLAEHNLEVVALTGQSDPLAEYGDVVLQRSVVKVFAA